MALQRRRAHAVVVDDATGIDQTIEELATDVLASGALCAVVGDYGLLEIIGPLRSQRVVVLLGLVAEDLCAKHSDAIDA